MPFHNITVLSIYFITLSKKCQPWNFKVILSLIQSILISNYDGNTTKAENSSKSLQPSFFIIED